MAFQNLTLADLRRKALSYVGDVVSDSRFGPSSSGAKNSLCDGFINDGLLRIATDWTGIEDNWRQVATVGLRAYPLPGGFRIVKSVWYNGIPLKEASIEQFNFYTPGTTSWPSIFNIFGAGNQLLLGPDPPYQPFPITMQYYRSPQLLVEEGDVPEIPNEYRPALAYYAAAQMLLGDESLATYKEMMSQYGRLEETFREWTDGKSTQTQSVRNVTEGSMPYGWGWGGW